MSHKFIIISILTSTLLTITACIKSTTIVPNSTNMTLSQLAKTFRTESSCLANNGKWQKIGILQTQRCVLSSKDAGKTCTDSKQCELDCITKIRNIKPDEKAVGECTSTTNPFGCQTRITNGLAEPTLCID